MGTGTSTDPKPELELSREPVESTVCEALDDAARRWPDRIGWVFEDESVSFAEMKTLSDRAAEGFRSLGVRKGDIVAIWTPNLAEAAVTAFACFRLGAVMTALNTRFKAFEAAHVLSHSEAKVLVIQPRFLGIDFEQILLEAAPDLTVSDGGVVLSASLPALRRLITVGQGRLAALPWSAVITGESGAEALGAGLSPDSPALLQYTSGTTARPKGALLAHRLVLNYTYEVYARLGVREAEPILNTQPIYHVGGACGLTVPLLLGCSVVMPSHYNAERVLELIERERCVSRSGNPTMYLMELDHPRFAEFDLSSLRSGWTGGPPAILDRIRDGFGGIELVQLYGATEGGGTAGSIDEPWEKRRVSAGRLITGTEIKLIDPQTGREVPTGQTGEICLRGWDRMLRYYRAGEPSKEVIDADGWLRMGDLARFDEEGYLYFVGRLKDMIRVGGENTSAEEVESVLLEHPGIHQAVAIGVPDARLGEVVLAIVERTEGSGVTTDEVIAHCRARAANFRVPRHVRFVTEWPTNGSGKIVKQTLRDTFAPEFDHFAWK
jgi:fatty-acyl-CoA synthase/long-chain acyl-CoA synthetase